jgi:hypothetical protein
VLPSIASANRDDDHFPDADRFDIFRKPGEYLSFGFGPHGCLGAPLAEEETRIALEILLRRVSNIKLTRIERSNGTATPQTATRYTRKNRATPRYDDSRMYWGASIRFRMSLTGRGAQPLPSSVSMRGLRKRARRPLVWSSHEPAAKTFFTQSLCAP